MASILVTGGNRGIGLGLVKELLKDQKYGTVIATTRSIPNSKELSAIKDPRLHLVELDALSDASIKAASDKVAQIVGGAGLDVLVNNSGVLIPYDLNGPVDRTKVRDNFEVNVVGAVIITQVFLPLLRKAKAAKIVNISSFLASLSHSWGSVPGRNFTPYSMSKTALNQLTASLAVDLKDEPISIISVDPGWVQTDMGGKEASITVEQSVTSLASTIGKANKTHSGGYFDRDLKTLTF